VSQPEIARDTDVTRAPDFPSIAAAVISAVNASRVPTVELVIRCAWCEHLLPEAERDHGDNVSHGICDKHAAEFTANARARRAGRV
jgi:hypothetical protein